MAGIEIFKAVKKAARDLKPGANFVIHYRDYNDLLQLTSINLVALGYDRDIADEVSFALSNADFAPLERTMGLKFRKSRNTPHLTPE